jgi:hypothetical protein
MIPDSDSKALVPAESRPLATVEPAHPFGRPIVVPKLVSDAGDRAARRFANFFGSIENDNTRAAYQRALRAVGLDPTVVSPGAILAL